MDGRRRKLTSTWCLLGHAGKLTFLSAFSGNLDRGNYDVLQIVGGENLICWTTSKRRKASVNECREREAKRARKSSLKNSGYPEENNDDESPYYVSKKGPISHIIQQPNKSGTLPCWRREGAVGARRRR